MRLSRRSFIQAGAGAWAASLFNIVPSSVLGKNAPSNKIVMGMVGVGGQGQGDMKAFLGQPDVIVKAVCDVNDAKMKQAKKIVDEKSKNSDCLMIKDFRELCSRDDIDAIQIATPDHWHAYVGTYALAHGKDVYGEKPFTHDLLEGRAVIRAVERYGRVWQTGSQQRSGGEFRRVVELVRNGRLGKIARVEVGLPGGGRGKKPDPNAKIPEGLDWNFWLGPAPFRPFMGIYDWDWRWNLEWGGGQLMDWVGHHGDIAQWALDMDRSGPVEFDGYAPWQPEGIYDSPKAYYVQGKYANGIELVIADDSQVRAGTTFYGESGKWLWVNRGRYEASDVPLRESKIEAGEFRLQNPGNHMRNFVDSVKNRNLSVANAEASHRSASLGHLSMISILCGRKIKWNPEKEEIIGDPVATGLLGRAPRGPWTLC